MRPSSSISPLLLLALLAACEPKSGEPGATDGTSTGPATTDATDPTTGAPEPDTTSTTDTADTADTADTTDATPTGTTDDPTGVPPVPEPVELDAQGCVPVCVRDVDPSTPVLEPSCAVFEEDPVAETRVEIVPCEEVAGEWAPPAGETVCFAALVDPAGFTPSPLDDMEAACVDGGANLQIRLVRTEPPAPGVVIEATCEPSVKPLQDCPGL